jgi:hypothetical protein
LYFCPADDDIIFLSTAGASVVRNWDHVGLGDITTQIANITEATRGDGFIREGKSNEHWEIWDWKTGLRTQYQPPLSSDSSDREFPRKLLPASTEIVLHHERGLEMWDYVTDISTTFDDPCTTTT